MGGHTSPRTCFILDHSFIHSLSLFYTRHCLRLEAQARANGTHSRGNVSVFSLSIYLGYIALELSRVASLWWPHTLVPLTSTRVWVLALCPLQWHTWCSHVLRFTIQCVGQRVQRKSQQGLIKAMIDINMRCCEGIEKGSWNLTVLSGRLGGSDVWDAWRMSVRDSSGK